MTRLIVVSCHVCVLCRALLRWWLAATGMPIIIRSVLMGSVIGALAYSTASTVVAFVRAAFYHQWLSHFSYTDRLPSFSTAGCQSTWCRCVVFSKNEQRLRHLEEHGAPLPGGGETYDRACCMYGALQYTEYGLIKHVCFAILPYNSNSRTCPCRAAPLYLDTPSQESA